MNFPKSKATLLRINELFEIREFKEILRRL